MADNKTIRSINPGNLTERVNERVNLDDLIERSRNNKSRRIAVRKGEKVVSETEYKLVRPLGEGGMGCVWEAVDSFLGRKVAIKFTIVNDYMYLEGLKEEARIAGNLSHDNIAKVHAVLSEPHFAVVYEHVEGYDLEKIMQRNSLKKPKTTNGDVANQYEHLLGVHKNREAIAIPNSIVAYTLMMLDRALNYAHTQEGGIFHRDIDLGNVMFDNEGSLKLLDFGIAARKVKIDKELEQGLISGKIMYLPPEVLWPVKDSYSGSADVYQTFLMAYEMLTGINPQFDYKHAAELSSKNFPNRIAKHIEILERVKEMQKKTLVPPVYIAEHIDPRFSEIVWKGLKGEITDAKSAKAIMENYLYEGGIGLTQGDMKTYLLSLRDPEYYNGLSWEEKKRFYDRIVLPEMNSENRYNSGIPGIEKRLWQPFQLKPNTVRLLEEGRNPARL